MGAIAVFMAACASTTQNRPAVPAVVQPQASPVAAMSASAANPPDATYDSEEESETLPPGKPVETSLRPADVPPGTEVWPSPAEVDRLRRENPKLRIINHGACKQDPGRRPQSGEYLAVTTTLVPVMSGWKCNGRVGHGGPLYLPPGAGVWMKIGPDGRPDPAQPGWQSGCGNDTEFLDKNPDHYRWYRTEESRPQKQRQRQQSDVNVPLDLVVTTLPPPRKAPQGVEFAATVQKTTRYGRASPVCRYIYGYWPIGSHSGSPITINDLRAETGYQRVVDVDGMPVPFPQAAYTPTLPFDSEVAYLAQCRIDDSIWNGQILVVDLPSPSFCEAHGAVCAGLKWGGGLVAGALVGYEINRLFINPPPKQQPSEPCFGHCTADPTFPKTPWVPGTPTQPGPGPTFPGDPNPAPGPPPPPNPGPGWPGNNPPNTPPTSPPPTTPPPPGPTWPGH